MACVSALSSSLAPDKVSYVGRSKLDTAGNRLGRHLFLGRNSQNLGHKNNWIRSVLKQGGSIVSLVLESGLSWGESGQREIFRIAHYKSVGYDLTNMTDGGDGVIGFIHSVEARAKMSAANLGRVHSLEHRAKIRVAQLGNKRSPETRAKISAAGLGRVQSPEHRTKIGAGHLGIKPSLEARAKMSAAGLGKPKSPEHRAKIGAAHKGRVLSPEHRAKISATLRNRYRISTSSLI